MRRFALALAFCGALVPVSAEALSCAPWSPAQAFERADASARKYSVVVGTFDFDASALPGGASPARRTVVPAGLTGRALSRTGFSAPYSEKLRLEVGCALSWCGGVIPGEPYLVFVEQTGSGPVVELGPCATVVFPNPTPAVERDITRCLTTERCGAN